MFILNAYPDSYMNYVPRTMGAQLAAPVAALHAAAFGLGYVLCKLLGFDEKTARTVSIETGAGRWLTDSTLTLSTTLSKSLTATTFVTTKGEVSSLRHRAIAL